jgi:3-hydroxyisobutyrate dehydrogenase-like beta-hydroxyacid dehydrogenase
MQLQRIGLIGYGEVGKTFGAGLRSQVLPVAAWDLKFAADDTRVATAQRAHATQAGILACDGMAALCAACDLLICAVTASQTLEVARQAAAHLRPGTVFLDLNSASPATKQQAAAGFEAAGGRYVEAGVMTSVPPYGIRVPMLLGGPHAAELAPVLTGWGMDATVVSDQLGVASAIKMCRSVMIKGLEALVIESYTTARRYGVEDHMIPTLQETFPGIDWQQVGAYFFSRVVQHGQRRAEEMRESAHTVREAGFEPFMAAAIAGKQQWVADRAKAGVFDGVDTKHSAWQVYADRLIGDRGAH